MRWKALIDKSYSDPSLRAALHGIFWLLIFGSNYYFNTISFNGYSSTPATWLLATKSTLNLAIFYYLLMYGIYPRLFLKKRYLTGSVALVLLIVGYAFADAFEEQRIFSACRTCGAQLLANQPVYYHYLMHPILGIVLSRILSLGLIYQLIILLSLPIALKTGRSYFRQTVQQLQLAKDNLQLEFNFLKAQVNPHFLFNTLNNIYSMVIHNRQQEAAATIARLSGFMRFTLYDSNEDRASLEKEVQLLKDYIELERLRLNQTRVTFEHHTDGGSYSIPPLLFMPAFENAFKYSADDLPDSYIHMDLRVVKGLLQLTMENRFDPRKQGRAGGIGLQNMQKRLRHYYPENYRWSVTTTENIFTLTLSLQLQ